MWAEDSGIGRERRVVRRVAVTVWLMVGPPAIVPFTYKKKRTLVKRTATTELWPVRRLSYIGNALPAALSRHVRVRLIRYCSASRHQIRDEFGAWFELNERLVCLSVACCFACTCWVQRVIAHDQIWTLSAWAEGWDVGFGKRQVRRGEFSSRLQRYEIRQGEDHRKFASRVSGLSGSDKR